jgi:hypothetical protein
MPKALTCPISYKGSLCRLDFFGILEKQKIQRPLGESLSMLGCRKVPLADKDGCRWKPLLLGAQIPEA